MEPVSLTLAGVGAVALSEGIKFLYAEAGDLLKRWLDRKKEPDAASNLQVEVRLPDAFEGQLRPATVTPDTFAKNERALGDAFQQLSLYASGVKAIAPSDTELLDSTARLRSVLESILGQTITLKGEQRPASGTPVVRGVFTADNVSASGDGAGVRVKSVRSGLIEGEAHVKTVEGKVSGAEVGEVGM